MFGTVLERQRKGFRSGGPGDGADDAKAHEKQDAYRRWLIARQSTPMRSMMSRESYRDSDQEDDDLWEYDLTARRPSAVRGAEARRRPRPPKVPALDLEGAFGGGGIFCTAEETTPMKCEDLQAPSTWFGCTHEDVQPSPAAADEVFPTAVSPSKRKCTASPEQWRTCDVRAMCDESEEDRRAALMHFQGMDDVGTGPRLSMKEYLYLTTAVPGNLQTYKTEWRGSSM